MFKISVCTLLLLGMNVLYATAASIVDVDEKHKLGAVLQGEADGLGYFSLGNGRALQIELAQSKKKQKAVVEELLLKRTDKIIKIRPVSRRNIKWR